MASAGEKRAERKGLSEEDEGKGANRARLGDELTDRHETLDAVSRLREKRFCATISHTKTD